MATATRAKISPADHGTRMTLEEFIEADWEGGYLYELARGVVDVVEVPGIHHGRIVMRSSNLFAVYDHEHPGVIDYRAAGSDCRLRAPGLESDRHPDQAIYLTPPPDGPRIWYRWVPAIALEIVSEGGEFRDYVEKREEYLRIGVLEYWILDPYKRTLLVLRREGDLWVEVPVAEDSVYQTYLLPGLEVRPAELLGPSG